MRLFIQLFLLIGLSLPLPVLADSSAQEHKGDLSSHSAYSKYDFGDPSRVINVGIQPLAVPIGVIGEVMKRDRILRKSLKDMGLEIRFHPFLKGEDINFLLRQGKIDAAMAGDMPAILTASSFDILITALAKQGFSSIVAKGPLTVAGLKRKRIGYPAVSNAHYALLAALASANMKESDVRMIPMEITKMVDALADGRIEAFAAWEPVPSIALRNIDNAQVIYRYLNSSYLYFSRSLADRHPEADFQLVAALIRALRWMKANEEHLRQASVWTLAAGGRLQGRPVPLSAEDIAVLTKRDILSITAQPSIPERDLTDKGSIRMKFDFLKSRGLIAPEAAWEKVSRSFDRAVITGVMASSRKYRLNSFDYDMVTPDR